MNRGRSDVGRTKHRTMWRAISMLLALKLIRWQG
jgi:hypothetical protein